MLIRWAALACGWCSALLISAADFAAAEQTYLKGDYEECLQTTSKLVGERFFREDWAILHSKTLLTLGRYGEAQAAISNAMVRHSGSIRVRLLAYDIFRQNGQVQRADTLLEEINLLGGSRMGAYRDAPNLVALGQGALLLGADPKLVLENFFNPAKQRDPAYRETYLAIGKVALDKYDDDLAAKTFQEGLKHFPKDPDIHFGLAKAYASSNRPKLVEHLDAALGANKNHLPSLLLLADHMIDAEEYSEADKNLGQVLKVNPHHPDAWAYRAVLAHLRNDPAAENEARSKALRFWETNPRVDYLIGQKLSQKYRFAEGAEYQRRALGYDSGYLPSRIQLAQDLLRLGEDEEGWKLAEEVHRKDGYDVVAYNLVTLNDSISKFRILTNETFVVRMHPHEADVYGDRVLALLQRAKDTLCQKYGFELDRKILIEIFPEQKDFAVRTFGMPGGEGFLGVCFGSVVTANSPASQAALASNWEAVLWHEFCHVITLGLTRNKMPRWLSEGISVYEERQANPAWGQTINPQYRSMVLKGELTPISELSGAFLTPKSGLHLQFAYYQSSLVVQFLVERFGLDAIKAILKDLGQGKPINPTIEAHTMPLETLEKEFTAYARGVAEGMAPKLDWAETKPERPGDGLALRLAGTNPNNYYNLVQQAKKLLAEKKFEEAKAPANILLEAYPTHAGADNPYLLLAAAHRGLGETDQEEQMLAKLAALSADSVEVYKRLMELRGAKEDWAGVLENSERFLAVNPLIPTPYRFQAKAAEQLGRTQEAIRSYRKLLLLDQGDQTEAHFRLAKLLHQTGEPEAKKHVLQALEEAPRFQAALDFLLTLTTPPPPATPVEAKPEPAAAPAPVPPNAPPTRAPAATPSPTPPDAPGSAPRPESIGKGGQP